MMRNLYVWNSSMGPFFIAEHEGRYLAIFDDENLGSYATPAQAADDLAGGHTSSISSGVDTATLGISEDLGDWHRGPN
jgi:hypothetical protein